MKAIHRVTEIFKDKSISMCSLYFVALSSDYKTIQHRIQNWMQASFQKLDNMTYKMKENGIYWVPTVCFTQGKTLSFFTQFHQNPRTFSSLMNSLHRSLSGERWIKDNIQADLTTNKTIEQVQKNLALKRPFMTWMLRWINWQVHKYYNYIQKIVWYFF